MRDSSIYDPMDSRPPAAIQAASNGRFVPVQVVGRTPAARDAVTFWLAAPGTTRAPALYRPGQFITLAITPSPPISADQRTDDHPVKPEAPARPLYRSYSLCGDGTASQPWEITVKRQQAGRVSSFLFAHVTPGMVLPASKPSGAFSLPSYLDPRTPLVFVAAGSGITPLYGMLRQIARLAPEARPLVHLHYGYRNTEDAIYGRQLTQLDPQHVWLHQWHYRSAHQQRLSPVHVLVCLQDAALDVRGTRWYVCGPDALKRAMLAAAERAGVPAAQRHAEVFASPRRPAMSAGSAELAVISEPSRAPRFQPVLTTSAAIRVAETGVRLDVRSDETLLEALERHGYEPDFSCRAGSCGTCRLRLLAGHVMPPGGDPEHALTAKERAGGYIVSCSTRPVGEVTVSLAGVAASVVAPSAASSTHQHYLPAAAYPSRGMQEGEMSARRQARRARQPARALQRTATQRWLGRGVAAACILLFGGVWGLTNHRVPISSPSFSLPALPSLPSFFTPHTDDNGENNPQTGGSSPNGSGSFGSPSGSNQPVTGTGTS